ncbi:MAG: type IX secretion system outer membrane channel protein PorV [Fimbriimonadaceae bacterium]|nr:type IX secretion system outer membrane channel protein PorV [Chitinophagales bacterium]
MRSTILSTAILSILFYHQLSAQISPDADTCQNHIQTEGYILQITPDARAASLGDMGTATAPDENSIFHNTSALAFIESDYGFSAGAGSRENYYYSYNFYHLSTFYKIDSLNILSVGGRLLDLPGINITDINGSLRSEKNPYQSNIEIGYARKLNKVLSVGFDIKYIREDYGEFNLGYFNGVEIKQVIANGFAADLSLFFQKAFDKNNNQKKITAGAVLSNIGNQISVLDFRDEKYFLPQNLSLGTGYKTQLNKNHSLFAGIEFNKLLVPALLQEDKDEDGFLDHSETSTVAGIFESFADAPCGCAQELQEISISAGAEYWFRNFFAARVGYYYAHPEQGINRLFTTGIGAQYKNFELDLSMQVNTVPEEDIYFYRATLLSTFNKKEKMQ